jgi:F0F1-type ATP synthase membrane subunit c/vacuolar-type H+-ATPase subunit K
MATTRRALPPLDRTPHATRVNRVLLTLLGLLLLAAGLAGLAVGLGMLGPDRAQRRVIDAGVTGAAASSWFRGGLALAAALVAVLALVWLLSQLRTDRVRDLDLEADRSRGRTLLHTRAVSDAVTDEVETYRGVSRAHAHMHGDAASPKLVLRAVLDGRVAARDIADRVVSDAVPHTRQALDAPDLPVRVEMRLATRTQRTPL